MSEPTTGEIVRILRGYADDIRSRAATDIPTPPEEIAADRLESQEATIASLTARAEQAEARENAALEDMKDYCQFCRYCDEEDDEEPCNECENVTHDERESKWTWRGQPQEGEKE